MIARRESSRCSAVRRRRGRSQRGRAAAGDAGNRVRQRRGGRRRGALQAAFRKGLSETGYVEGQHVNVEYHWLAGQYDRLPALIAELIRRRVSVIATPGTPSVMLTAQAATSTIPIVFGVRGPSQTRSDQEPCPAGRQHQLGPISSPWNSMLSGLGSSTNWCPKLRASPYWSIPPMLRPQKPLGTR